MIVLDTPSHRLWQGRRVRTAHLVSSLPGRTGREELLAFGAGIGMKAAWLQSRGTAWEHFDLMGPKIEAAESAGAIRVDRARFVTILRQKGELTGELPSQRVRRIRNVLQRHTTQPGART